MHTQSLYQLRQKLQQRLSSRTSQPTTSDSADSLAELRKLLKPVGREEAVAALKVTVAIGIRSGVYADPLRVSGIARTLIGTEAAGKWFTEYCIEPYPDACICGTVFYGSSNSLRNHCILCKGQVPNRYWHVQNIVRGLDINLGIHPSWSEYAIAWYHARYQVMVIGGE